MSTPTTWIYIKSEPNCYTVGFYRPDGKFEPESDHAHSEDAALRVHFLNGGNSAPLAEGKGDQP